MKISICIPTLNRGNRAIDRVNELIKLPYDEDSLEIIVSNNGSNLYVDEYNQIEAIHDNRLKYNRLDTNHGFVYNICHVIKQSSGDYCMLLSDEDIVDPVVFDYYYDQLRTHPGVHIMRPRTDISYGDIPFYYTPNGIDAVNFFFYNGNYISGITYDRSVLTDDVVDIYYNTYKDIEAFQSYPHMFFDTECLVKGGFFSDEYVLIHEGDPVKDHDHEKDTVEFRVPVYGTLEKRIEQMSGMIELINNIDTSLECKFQMLKILCEKTVFLVDIVRERYLESGKDWPAVLKEEKKNMKELIRKVELPLDGEDWEIMDEYVDGLVDSYEKKRGE